MYAGDELYDDEITSRLYDPLAGADYIRDYYRDHFACQTCGSPDPAVIEGRFCSDCKGKDAAGFVAARKLREESAA